MTPVLGSGFEPDPAGPCPGAPHTPCPALSGVRPPVVLSAGGLAQEGGASARLAASMWGGRRGLKVHCSASAETVLGAILASRYTWEHGVHKQETFIPWWFWM